MSLKLIPRWLSAVMALRKRELIFKPETYGSHPRAHCLTKLVYAHNLAGLIRLI